MGEVEGQRSKAKDRGFKFQVSSSPFWRGSGGETQDSGLRTQDLSPSGFTLLEVMVALMIMGIGLVSVLELFSGSIRLGVKASQRTQAAIYGQNVMDRIFAQEQLEDGEVSGELPNGYAWRARVQEIYPDDDNDRLRPEDENETDFLHLKEVEVSIVWQENFGQQEFVLHALRAVMEQPDGGLERGLEEGPDS
jgi:prepilin-type N-terminal cleavage/methylation domain-containing protein